MKAKDLVEYIIDYCKNNNVKKVYICGNGGSGKTTLSYNIEKEASKYGNVNIISTDYFIVNTELRKNAINKWISNNQEYSYRYTSSNKESYFMTFGFLSIILIIFSFLNNFIILFLLFLLFKSLINLTFSYAVKLGSKLND